MQSPKIRKLTSLFARLPGVGEKTAARYVLFLLSTDPDVSRSLGAELETLLDVVRTCAVCGGLTEVDPEAEGAGDETRAGPVCDLCTDAKRDSKLLCVVARFSDLLSIERTGAMRGRYFVLGRLLSPLDGVGPEQLPLGKLAARIREGGVTEVIVATPPSVDGEATALLLKRELAPLGVSLTRIASGVPHGGDLEYADPITMGRALSGRQRL